MTDDRRLVAEAWYRHEPWCAATRIRDKGGVQVPFLLTPAQVKLNDAILEMEGKGLPVRIVCVKARQVHMSVGAMSQAWRRCAFWPGIKARVFADVFKNSANLFNYFRQMYENYQPVEGVEQLPALRWLTGQMVEFAGGGMIEFGSAERASGGRSASVRILINSELAFWRDAKQLRTGLAGSIPYEPGTIIIDESTANGRGGAFYEQWKRAELGESGWRGVFFGWHEHPEYRTKLAVEPYHFERSLTEPELAIKGRFNLSLEQLNWRRLKIRVDCEGDEERFKQEFPCTAEEAFLTSGRPRFDRLALAKMPVIDQPLTGELERVKIATQTVLHFSPRDDGRGALRIWRRPEPRHLYVIGADASEGIDVAEGDGQADPDYCAFSVLDATSGEQVAVLRARIEAMEAGRYLADLGRFYYDAFLVPEANGPGLAMIDELRRQEYPLSKIYHRPKSVDQVAGGLTGNIGFKTTVITRPQLISRLDSAIRQMGVIVRDKITLDELENFVYKANGRVEAGTGSHDDTVIALALAIVGVESAVTAQRVERAIGAEGIERYRTFGRRI